MGKLDSNGRQRGRGNERLQVADMKYQKKSEE